MKLESKLNISTGILVFAMVASAATAHWRLAKVMRLTTEIATERGPFIRELNLLHQDVADSLFALQSSIIEGAGSSEYAANRARGIAARERMQTDIAHLQQIKNNFALGPDEDKLPEIFFRLGELEKLEKKIETEIPYSGSGSGKPETELRRTVVPLEEDILKTVGDLILSQIAQRSEDMKMLIVGDGRVVSTLWFATLLGALLGGSFSLLLSRRIACAIDLVAQRAAAIASGDLTGTELGVSPGDQIGALAQGMQSMQAGLATIIGTVASTAGTLSSSAVSMRSASDQMHRRIDQQAQQTQQAATAMQEMSASIAEVSRHTQSAAETARSAAQTAREGGSIVKQMLGSMHSIASAVTDTSTTMSLLGEDSKRISQIVTVINEIARKTNLLALNAAIEAARAGDQGRGFAVVAGEVRRLAESTAQATGEIASMIQGIQDRTRTAIASMASGTGTVQEGVVTTNQAGEALERIIGMADRVDRMITQIAIAASQQATAANQSSASLDSIHSLSNENLTEMSTTKAGIESLRGTVVRLEKQVDRFQVALA